MCYKHGYRNVLKNNSIYWHLPKSSGEIIQLLNIAMFELWYMMEYGEN